MGNLSRIPLILFCTAATIAAISSCNGAPDMDRDVAQAIRELDSIIENEKIIEEGKHARIESLRSRLQTDISADERYWVMNDLFNEYFQYDVDSALFYSHSKMEIAMELDDREKIYDAIFDLADRYVTSGLNDEALKQIALIDTTRLDRNFSKRRNSLLNTVYSNMMSSTSDPVLIKRYEMDRNKYRDLMMACLDSTDIATAYLGANILMERDMVGQARELLMKWEGASDIDIYEKGILCYSIAMTYRAENDRQNAMKWFAKSASYDLQVPKYEYLSLIELAGMLYEDGDIERAYTYITRSVNDAVRAKAQNCKENVYALMPIISDSYDKLVQDKNMKMKFFLIILSVMTVLLIAMTLILMKEKGRVAEAEKIARERNEQLGRLNDELKKSNILLQESNSIKDSYLGRYLNMCSDYIDGLDRYRSSIRKIAKEEGTAKLLNALKSKAFIEEELEGFYAQFDATFLDLFPDFITQLNDLLQEDRQIQVHSRNKILSTELRVLALIRLGVTDSVRIAQFLRRSVSTIYNYRVKMKNSAKIDREDFEKELMKIGKRL